MEEQSEEAEHPAFTKAKSLKEPWRSHFPKSQEEAREFQAWTMYCALAMCVLVVAKTRVECAWAAYIDAVPGENHKIEQAAVLAHGNKLPERLARAIYPQLKDIPYAY
jgi:hypothetical protein